MDITKIVEAVITLLFAVLTTFLIPFLKEKIGTIKFDKMEIVVRAAVQAAEQIYTESGKGKEKKAFVEKFLQDKGIIIDTDLIDILIESSVLQLKKEIGE